MTVKNPRELEREQADAAYAIDRHISVTAGPGSGKTTVLVERYLHVLHKHNLSIDQIVAITFTNRAANEMRERLRERLNQFLQTAEGDERRRWLAYKRTLDGAVITTIHGFCARLLREFPVEAKVDPQFLLLDEHRAAMLLEAVVEETLTEFISSSHIQISRLTLGVGRGKLAAALAQLYRDVRGQGISTSVLENKAGAFHSAETDYAVALAELSEAVKRFLAVPRKTLNQRAKQSSVSSEWGRLEPFLQTIPSPESLSDYVRAVESFRSVRPSAVSNLKPYVHALDELIWEKDLGGRVPQICLDLFARQYALEMAHLLDRIDERLNEEKQRLSALDFDDLELRALDLLEQPAVLTRAAERYKFFLVDEFQDTNGLQRRLLEQLAFQKGRRESANLFIVGDRKQSIYGFRGADVDVFRKMTETLTAAGGESRPLLLNFRSQPPLIRFFNYLFAGLFQPKDDVSQEEREELGYVGHELSEARNLKNDPGPLVELLITTEASGDPDDPKAEFGSRDLDAEQLARRIIALVDHATVSTATVPTGIVLDGPSVNYSDIALLFRGMTNVQIYESVFRRANIPYQTVLGRGFYEREEITDLIQLLRFLDNKTDELALAAVLRSPLAGISDNALLALRCAPWLKDVDAEDNQKHFGQTRPLFRALRRHAEIAFINDEEHALLARAAELIRSLIGRRHHYSLSDLLRFAVEQSEFTTVIAATFDGAQRLANVQRLFTLAERFEQAGAHLIRDFVRYVEEFEAIGSRESEGQIDEAANAVRLMTIHQAKGLEFPVVIIPELQRFTKPMDNWFLLDRHRGLTLKVPDGRGNLIAGRTFSRLEQRHKWREEFESMRLLYVAATRAQDRLILSGTTKDLESLTRNRETWLRWIWQSLRLETPTHSGILDLDEGVQLQLTLNLADEPHKEAAVSQAAFPDQLAESGDSLSESFPLLHAIEPKLDRANRRFSVTQLINYQRCPRQYYFDRILHAPSADELAVWNDAEAPEPPANLTATLKGAVIHRFCETFKSGDDPEHRLRTSFADVIAARQAQLADRLLDINDAEALKELLPLAQNYLASEVFQRVERAARLVGEQPVSLPGNQPGLWSELAFRLRRPLGMLTGTIDKLLISPVAAGNGVEIEIIDFKTNRMSEAVGAVDHSSESATTRSNAGATMRARRPRSQYSRESQTSRQPRSGEAESQDAAAQQFTFAFDDSNGKNKSTMKSAMTDNATTIDAQVRQAAADYQLQMQAYALAVSELMPDLIDAGGKIKVTLHFLHPNVESNLSAELLAPDVCATAIDEAMREIVSASEPVDFPVRPAVHCRMCNFLRICPPGRDFVTPRQ
ncbi:MAG: UvrD-helicase domain-containing protein [bacterium]